MPKNCPYCEKQVSPGEKFCGWCGRQLPAELSGEEKETVEKIRKGAMEKEAERKRTQERAGERKAVEAIRKKAQGEVKEIKRAKTRREKIIERLTQIPKDEIKRREEFLKIIGEKLPKKKTGEEAPPKIKTEKVIFRPLEAKTPPFEKLFIRILFAVLALSVVAAVLIIGFDIFGWRTGPEVVLPPPAGEEEEEGEGEEEEKIIVPASLFSAESSTVLEISFLDRLPSAFSDLFEGLDEKTFTEIIIKNLEKREVVNLQDFLTVMGVTAPPEFYQYLEPNFTLLSYSPQKLHMGFIAEIGENQKENLSKLMLPREEGYFWEKEMKEDFGPFFTYLGKSKLMSAHPFIDKSYLGENFRYTTFYQENFGMYYGIIKNYFFFTTSEELMLKLIGYKVKLTETLKKGSRGTEVEILQTWLARDINIYPRGLITGYFGSLTHEALVRFQQKYSDEILKPYGLVEGTGIADEVTRQKLNEIHRK